MWIERLTVKNFRNLVDVTVPLSPGTVLVGENRAGKSNLLQAIRLVLDPTLSPLDRTLDRSDFSESLGDGTATWDPIREGRTVTIAVDLGDIENEPTTLAALGDALIEADPMRARLTYRFGPKEDAGGGPYGVADYEWSITGGEDGGEVRWDVRRFIGHVHLHALRDAEGDLASWRRSPLRPLIEAAADAIERDELDAVAEAIGAANDRVAELRPIQQLGHLIARRTEGLVGERQALETRLEVAPTEPGRLIRALRLLVDGSARRPLSAASLGALNVLYLALLDLGLDAEIDAEAIAHVVLTIEEPEAHLHPHVQRALFASLLGAGIEGARTVLVSTHSPHIVSVAEPHALVLLRQAESGTTASAAGEAELDASEWRDLRRYLDATRSEMVFASRVILVEGFAELVLMPRFAQKLDIDLDRLGITVSAVHGTHFATYVRFLQALGIPWVVATDGDPDRRRTGAARAASLLERLGTPDREPAEAGIFVGQTTLERDIYDVSIQNRMRCLKALRCEDIPAVDVEAVDAALNAEAVAFRDYCRKREASHEGASVPQPARVMPSESFLAVVEKAGKGSFAQRLAAVRTAPRPPRHIRLALARISE